MSTTDRDSAADAAHSGSNVSSDANASSVRSTLSRKKLAANRRNARKSTGPRTGPGKRVSAYNAVTHGVFCEDLLLPGEDAFALDELRRWIHRSLRIDGDDVIEIGYADDVLAARWKLRRVSRAERDLHGSKVARWRRTVARQLARHERRTQSRLEFAWNETEEKWINDDAERRRGLLESFRDGPNPDAGATLAGDFTGTDDGLGTWERLSRYEQRLQQNLASAMRELRAYRKEKRDLGPAEPIDDDDADDGDGEIDAAELFADEAQNEPTAEQTAVSDEAAGGCETSDRGLGVPPEQAMGDISTGEAPVPQ